MNLDSFTYGWEIEGIFTKRLLSRLMTGKSDLVIKTDGSVKYEKLLKEYRQRTGGDDDIYKDKQEITLGVFKEFDGMVKALSLINESNHVWDQSCGMHLHIKPKRSLDLMQGRIIDYDFMDKLQKFADSNLCEHIKERNNNQYCKRYNNIQELTWNMVQDKYRFIRLHNQYKTFEMRFLSPCEHKVDNVKKFMAYFVQELNPIKTIKTGTIVFEDSKPNIITKKVKLDVNDTFIEETVKLNEAVRIEHEREAEHDDSHEYEGLENCDCDDCYDVYLENHECCSDDCESDSCFDCSRCRERDREAYN